MSRKRIAGFEHIEQLGKGSYSEVHLVYRNGAGSEKMALKRFLEPENTIAIEHEIAALKVMSDHPDAPKLHDVISLGKEVFLLMDYIEGDNIYQTVKKSGTFSESQARRFLKETLSQLGFMHAQGLLHTDIKITNLMKHKGKYCFIDYGLSQAGPATRTLTLTGGERYMGPEVFQGLRNQASDVYGLGCVLHYCLTGKYPFGLVKKDPMEKKIFASMHWNVDFRFDANPEIKHILSRMMEKDHMQRATIEEIECLLNGDLDIGTPPSSPAPDIPLPEDMASIYRTMAQENRKNLYAQYRYGLLLEKGETVTQDERQAIEWHLRAATGGLALAQNRLGFLYYNGRCGLPKDYDRAHYWFSKASDQKYPLSQYYMGRLHELGWGVRKDNAEAIRYYTLAVRNGETNAKERLQALLNS